MVNLRELPDEELEHMIDTTGSYLRKLENERARRETITEAADSINRLAEAYMQAVGVEDGAPWVGPSSAAEAYPRGWFVTHEYGLWKSRVAGNIEEPGQGESWEWVGRDPRVVLYPGQDVLPGDDVILGSDEDDVEDVEVVDDDETIEPGGDDA